MESWRVFNLLICLWTAKPSYRATAVRGELYCTSGVSYESGSVYTQGLGVCRSSAWLLHDSSSCQGFDSVRSDQALGDEKRNIMLAFAISRRHRQNNERQNTDEARLRLLPCIRCRNAYSVYCINSRWKYYTQFTCVQPARVYSGYQLIWKS